MCSRPKSPAHVCAQGRFCPANLSTSYFAAAARLRETYGATRLLLATDDAHAARLCASGHMGFACVRQPISRRKFEAAGKQLIEDRVAAAGERGELSGSAVALDALADLDMLGDCDAFVLVLRSCFSRVAYALALGRRGTPPPLISLEAPWSPNYGKGMKLAQMSPQRVHRRRGARARGARRRPGPGP